jgi:hypothetical protein
MRHAGLVLRTVGLILLAAGGCHLQPDLKPPKEPESFVLPPENDKYTLQPICYPSEVLASDDSRKTNQTPAGAKKGPPGAVPGGLGMGGMPPGGGY